MHANNSRLLHVMALLSFLFFAACSKSDEKSNTAKTKTELITTSTWKYSTAGIDQNGDGTKDFDLPAGILEDCDTDNILTFKSDSTGIVDEGPTKCDAANPQSTAFTWSFKNNETEINFSTAIFPGIGGDAKIIELTDLKLTLSQQVTIPGIPLPVTVILVLVH